MVRLGRIIYVFAGNGVDNIIRRSAKKLRDDGELIDVIFAGEEGLALQHLGEDAASTPDVDLDIVFLPREHDLGRTVVSCRNISGHLGVLDTGKTKVADLQIAVFVDENVAGLEITMHDAGGMHIFQPTLVSVNDCHDGDQKQDWSTYHDLVEEVLDELLLQGPGGQQAMQIGTEKLGDEVDVFKGRDEDVTQGNDLILKVSFLAGFRLPSLDVRSRV